MADPQCNFHARPGHRLTACFQGSQRADCTIWIQVPMADASSKVRGGASFLVQALVLATASASAAEPAREWSAAAFSAARERDRPVLALVADGTAAETAAVWPVDPVVADRLARDFVAVQADRVLRPDLVDELGLAVRELGGGDGLPLLVALTPDGRPFAGRAGDSTRPRSGGSRTMLSPPIARRAPDSIRARTRRSRRSGRRSSLPRPCGRSTPRPWRRRRAPPWRRPSSTARRVRRRTPPSSCCSPSTGGRGGPSC